MFIPLPDFDLHRVEESLRICHRVFGGQPMTDAQIKTDVQAYREFLREYKLAGAPERFAVPSLRVDKVWHIHMCETKQYREDCLSYFGKIVEHASSICDGGSGGSERIYPQPYDGITQTGLMFQ